MLAAASLFGLGPVSAVAALAAPIALSSGALSRLASDSATASAPPPASELATAAGKGFAARIFGESGLGARATAEAMGTPSHVYLEADDEGTAPARGPATARTPPAPASARPSPAGPPASPGQPDAAPRSPAPAGLPPSEVVTDPELLRKFRELWQRERLARYQRRPASP